MAQLVLIGGGGHALVVAEAAALAGLDPSGFLDDDTQAVVAASAGLPWLGPLLAFDRAARGFILALGDLAHRREIIHQITPFEDGATSVVHPAAIVSPSASLGRGGFVGPGAIIHTNAAIAQHSIINSGAIIEHECHIGENVHIAPGAALGGRIRVGSDTLIGLGARILPNLRIGRACTIGAGAIVTRDVPDGQTVRSAPAQAAP